MVTDFTLVFHLQKKEARSKTGTSRTISKDSKTTGVSRLESKEGEVASTTTSMVEISEDEGDDDGHKMGDDDNLDSSVEDISSVEEQIRKIDLSLEKLQLEYQHDLDMTNIGR